MRQLSVSNGSGFWIADLFRRDGRQSRLVPRGPASQAALIAALDIVATQVVAARTVHDVLGIIVEAAKRFTGTEKVVLSLVEDCSEQLVLDESTLVVRGCRNIYLQEWWGERLPDIADDVFADGRPFFELDEEREAWLLAVPVRIQDRPLGLLVVINSTQHRLQREHTAFLSILGVFAAAAIENARLAEESRFALLASERERISREMHDGISQSLFSVSLGLDLCRRQIIRDPQGVARKLEELQSSLRSSMSELRRYIYDLRPSKLQELGLVGAIEYWVGEDPRTDGPSVRIDVRGTPAPLAADMETCLYRVAREAISNAMKHAQASSVELILEYRPQMVTMRITDDGHGFVVADAFSDSAAGSSVGLCSIRERVERADGTLAIESAPGRGSVVRVQMPIRGGQG